MKPKLIIDPGHGGKDPGGGSNSDWVEKDMNLAISIYQVNRFQQLNIPVAITRKNDISLSPAERTKIVRRSGADYCFSNHINAGGGDGAEVIHSIYGGKEIAKQIAQELEAVGQNVRRVFTRTLPGNPRRDYYFMNRETGRINTIIIEYGFADSTGDDIQQLRKNWKVYAEAVVWAFCKHIGQAYHPSEKNEQEQTAQRYLHLPAKAVSWRVYPIDVPPIKGNEKGFLRPAKFGGLAYEILGNPQSHVYIIGTRDFGKVQIYAHPKTGASFS